MTGCVKSSVTSSQVTYDVLEGLGDSLAGIPAFHDHGVLHILCQLRGSALQEALGPLRFGFSADTNNTKTCVNVSYSCFVDLRPKNPIIEQGLNYIIQINYILITPSLQLLLRENLNNVLFCNFLLLKWIF